MEIKEIEEQKDHVDSLQEFIISKRNSHQGNVNIILKWSQSLDGYVVEESQQLENNKLCWSTVDCLNESLRRTNHAVVFHIDYASENIDNIFLITKSSPITPIILDPEFKFKLTSTFLSSQCHFKMPCIIVSLSSLQNREAVARKKYIESIGGKVYPLNPPIRIGKPSIDLYFDYFLESLVDMNVSHLYVEGFRTIEYFISHVQYDKVNFFLLITTKPFIMGMERKHDCLRFPHEKSIENVSYFKHKEDIILFGKVMPSSFCSSAIE
jgi:hypothetical protein